MYIHPLTTYTYSQYTQITIMITPLQAIGVLLLGYSGLCTVQLLWNYRKAKAIGLPVLITPIDPVRQATVTLGYEY
jgi:hypothetical protein